MTSAVDLFCGIGWGFACTELGIAEHGIDKEPTVAATRTALGWQTTCADLLDLDPADWVGVEGIIASPPCQSWSRAGKGLGLDDLRGVLVWQPLVWARAIRPRWVVCEQVPEARQAFALIAHELEADGYHVDVFTLSAETLGVPQARLRVFLTAHRDRKVHRPALTHQKYRKGRARVEPVDMLGHLPWVSMAEALDEGFLDRPALTVRGASETGGGHGMDGGSGARAQIAKARSEGRWLLDRRASYRDGRPTVALVDPFEAPRPTITAEAVGGGVWSWTLRGGNQPNRAERRLDEPAPTIPAHVGKNQQGDSWAFERPSTTVCADPRVSAPVHHDGSQTAGAVPWTDAGVDKPVALTEAQGCALMGFPAGTETTLVGNKQDRWRIIGNAVCPPVGKALLSEVLAASLRGAA